MSNKETFKVDTKVLREVLEELAGNIETWPLDRWEDIEGVIDLNMFRTDGEIVATIYPVEDRHTDTQRFIRIFDISEAWVEE